MQFKKINIFSTITFSFALLSSCTTSENSRNHNKSSQTITSLAPTTPFESNTLDGILATVADQVILLSDLQQAILISSNGQTKLLSNGKLVGGSITIEQANQILDSLINHKVLQIKASELGLEISEDELSQRIQEFLKQRGFSENDLENQLLKSKKSMQDYRLEFKNEILKQQLIGKIISPFVSVSEDEVKNFYLQQTGSVKQLRTVNLRSLVIKIPENNENSPLDSPIVKEVTQKINNGENFITLVKQYSMSSDALTTEGKLPPKPISDLPTLLRDKLTNLKIDQVIGPFIIGKSVFFFQYLGADFITDSDFQKNFSSWKEKLQNIKFNERLSDYLKSERAKLRTNLRPFYFNK